MSKVKIKDGYYLNKFGGLHSPDLITPWARASFVNLKSPSTKFDPPKYGVTLLCPRNEAEYPEACKDKKAPLKIFQQTAIEMAEMLFGAKVPDLEYNFLRDGNSFVDNDGEIYTGFKDQFVIVAKNSEQPTPATGQSFDTIVAGVWVRAQVQMYLNKDGYSYKLRGIKFLLDDGVRYNSAPPGDSMLNELDDVIENINVVSEPKSANASLMSID
jgi:hypothetical protein